MDETSFPNADTQAVAGRLNRTAPTTRIATTTMRTGSSCAAGPPALPALPRRPRSIRTNRLQGTTRTDDLAQLRCRKSSPSGDENIVVTAMRARQENLGDLKLYRIPEPVTVAANSQKQVAFLEQPAVRVQLVYRNRIESGDSRDPGSRPSGCW